VIDTFLDMQKLIVLAVVFLTACPPTPPSPPPQPDADASAVVPEAGVDDAAPAPVTDAAPQDAAPAPPADAGLDDCARAQATLEKLGCKSPVGQPLAKNKHGVPFAVTCREDAAKQLDVHPKCIAAATSCDGVKKCSL